VFGNVHNMVTYVEKALQAVQDRIQLDGHSDALMCEEKKCQSILNEALLKQETFWQEKAKIRWHVNGDRNTTYFHRLTKIKNKTKIISSINIDDEIVLDPIRVSDHIVNYYKNLFFFN